MATATHFVPTADHLAKAREKKSFVLVVEGQRKNEIFEKWERYAYKKGLSFTNEAAWKIVNDLATDMIYWILLKAPAIDVVLDYARLNPSVRMRIYL